MTSAAIVPQSSKSAVSATSASPFASDPLRALAPELRALVYAELRAADCLALAQTNTFHGNHDAELWRALTRPLRRVPLNAADAWQAYQSRCRRDVASPRMQCAVEFERDIVTLQVGILAMVGLVAGVGGSILGIGRRGDLGADLTPAQAGEVLGKACLLAMAAAIMGAAPYTGWWWSQARQQRAWAPPLQIPPTHTATWEEFNRPIPELRAWICSLKAALSDRVCWINREPRRMRRLVPRLPQPRANATREAERFLFDTLRLPIPLSMAVAANRPDMLARSLKTIAYLESAQTHAAFSAVAGRSDNFVKFFLRVANEKMHRPSLVTQLGDAPQASDARVANGAPRVTEAAPPSDAT